MPAAGQSPDPATLAAARHLADRLADTSGDILRRYFRSRIDVEDKADASPVTIADREAEAAIRRQITAHFPTHGIIGEEYGAERSDADWVWVLDPIDGTKSFISGVPLFGTLIALLYLGRPVIGVLDQPISRERWVGALGQPSTLNGQAIAVRECPSLDKATLFATSPDMFKGPNAALWQHAAAAAKLVRYGADCYAYGLVAAGFCDGVVEASLKPYDYCAHIPIIEGAGGMVTDWQGRPAGLASDGRIIAAADRRVHEALVTLLG